MRVRGKYRLRVPSLVDTPMSAEDTPIDGEDRTESNNLPNEGRPFIMIRVMEDGTVDVQGFVPNNVVAYGMLGVARDQFHAAAEKKSKIERVNGSGGLLRHIRNGFHKGGGV